MKTPPNNHVDLWNDLPIEERKRLMPHVLETQLLNIWQCKQKAIKNHNKHIKELDDWMLSIKKELQKIT